MADALEAMLGGAGEVLGATDRKRIAEVRRLDDVLDRLNLGDSRISERIGPGRADRGRSPAAERDPGVHHEPGGCRRRDRPRRHGPPGEAAEAWPADAPGRAGRGAAAAGAPGGHGAGGGGGIHDRGGACCRAAGGGEGGSNT